MNVYSMDWASALEGDLHSSHYSGSLEEVPVSYEARHMRTIKEMQRNIGDKRPSQPMPRGSSAGYHSLKHRPIRKKAVTSAMDSLVGARLKVPPTHPNKYGYATGAVILSTTNSRALIQLDITSEVRWHPIGLVRRWMQHDVESLTSSLALVNVRT